MRSARPKRSASRSSEGTSPISSSLRAAYAPEPASDLDHEAILARALGDLDAPPTDAESRAAERLREALATAPPRRRGVAAKLDRARGTDAELDAELFAAIRHASAPSELDTIVHESILDRVVCESRWPSPRKQSGRPAMRFAKRSSRAVNRLLSSRRFETRRDLAGSSPLETRRSSLRRFRAAAAGGEPWSRSLRARSRWPRS